MSKTLALKGEHVRRSRWVHGDRCVVRVEVDAVIPDDDPSEPCYEPATVEFLREVRERADAGDIEWLRKIGDVYARVSA